MGFVALSLTVSVVEGDDVHAPDEAALIRQAQRGDREAFAELVRRYWSGIYHLLHGVTRCAHSAEDLTQDVFMRAWEAMPRYGTGNFRAWLFRIARNRFTDFLREKHSVRALPEDTPGKEKEPLVQAIQAEHQSALEHACGLLPEKFRAAFLLFVREEMSHEEIAEVLDISVVTARWRVYKARRLLMRRLSSRSEHNP
jgi:RNA polymerase sigma-70 factor (ECF subfamily)